jgi:dolichol-phosphate mannosyltransferase
LDAEHLTQKTENQLKSLAFMNYSIIIPAYNEENRINRLLNSLTDPLAEFIFVCDGSDRTPEVINGFASQHPELTIRCLTFPCRLGKGGGVYEGLRAATSPLVGFMDADNSTRYDEMLRLLSQMDGYDGIIGSRHIPGSQIDIYQPLSRRLQSRIFNLIIRLLFGLDFHDTQCGAKIFRREAITRIMPALCAKGFEFDVELLWKLRRAGFAVKEEPVAWNDTGDSRLQTSDAFSMLKTLLKLRLGLLCK